MRCARSPSATSSGCACNSHYRSIIDRVAHVVVYDDGDLVLMRVQFADRDSARPVARACAGQLTMHGIAA